MKLSQPLLALCLAASLYACGGGDASDTRLPDANSANKVGPGITVTVPYLTGGKAYTTSGAEAVFEGGVCGGGNGQLSALWIYGDGSSSTAPNRHTYVTDNTIRFYDLVVKCTDTANNPWATVTAHVEVRP